MKSDNGKKRISVIPYAYKADGLKDADTCISALCDDYDICVITDEKVPNELKRKNVEYSESNPRRRSYMETISDYIIDFGAASGTGKMSEKQTRICIDNDKLRDKYNNRDKDSDNTDAIDYFSSIEAFATDATTEEIDHISRIINAIDGVKLLSKDLRYNEVKEIIEDDDRKSGREIVFLTEYLSKKDELHSELNKLAEFFVNHFNTKNCVIGNREFDFSESEVNITDSSDVFFLKLSLENNHGTARNVIRETNGTIVIFDRKTYRIFKDILSEKHVVCLFSDKEFSGERRRIKRKSLYSKALWTELFADAKVFKQIDPIFLEDDKTKKSLFEYQSESAVEVIEKEPFKAADKPMVSVVIPYYRDAETISDAVKSIENNGYENYEIILVNDGGTENPMDFLSPNERIKYCYKENGGPGSARNYGIDVAQGKYILFLDADDTSEEAAISRLVEFAERNNLDMVNGKTVRHYKESGREEDWYGGVYGDYSISNMSDRGILLDDTICTGRLFNREYMKRNNLRFECGRYEDVIFMGKVYNLVDKIGIIPDCVQKWMVYGRGTSITTENTLINVQERLGAVDDVYMKSKKAFMPYYTRQFIRHHIIACVNDFIDYSEDERLRLYEMMKKSLELKKDTIVDRLIAMPSKKAFYKSLLNNDYKLFELLAEAFSETYRKKIGS